MKKRKGMSLVEVMMAFVLVGFLVLLVSGAVTSSYKTSAALQKLPVLYYKGQQEIEDELDELEKKVTQKYLIEKELASSPDDDLLTELAALNGEIEEGREKLTVDLFGKSVVVYQFERDCEIEDVGTVTFCAGTASGVRLERPVPVLDRAVINVIGEPVSPEVSAAVGKIITTEVSYSDINRDYCYAELYQWFVSEGDFHAVYYDDGTPGTDEILHGKLLPVYPGNFTPITSERTASMTVTDDCRGRFVFCLVTPLSINGKMGGSVMSNLIYVSDLPDGISYRAVIDPSLMTLPYEESGRHDVPVINSTGAATGSFTAQAGCPYIDLAGDAVSENSGAMTRFIHFDAAEKSKNAAGLAPKPTDVIFAVVRACDDTYPDFIKAGTHSYGFSDCAWATDPTFTGWVIMAIYPDDPAPEYILGGANVDIAELIIADNPGEDGIVRITEYLKNKYGIS